MDAGRPFSYVFEDSSWLVKLLVGGLLGVSFFLTPSLFGYLVDTARNVRDGRELPLPEWGEDFGGRWVRGLKLLVIFLVWGLVLYLPLICLGFVIGIAAGAGASGTGSGAEGAIAGASLLINCLSIPLSLIVVFFQPAIMAHYVDHGTLASGFQISEIWRRMSANWSEYLILWLLFLVASAISGLGALACAIGLLFTYPYAVLVEAHLIGQFVRRQLPPDTLDLA